MTNLQNRVEFLELQAIDAELLSLLTYDPNARARHRAVADQFRMQAVELVVREELTRRPAQTMF